MASNQLRTNVLSLYRNLLKNSQRFADYNYRMYAKKRVRDAFRTNKNLTDSTQIQERIKFGQDNLKVIERQAIIGNMYKDSTLVIEAKAGQKKIVS